MPVPTWLSWSSGKDSAWALQVLREDPTVDVVGLLTTITADYHRVSMHGVRRDLLDRQAAALGVPLHVVEIPAPCPNEIYEQRMAAALQQAREQGIEAIAFGDLFLADVRAYRERMLSSTTLRPLFPLWGQPTKALAHSMIDAGVRAVVTCLDPRQVDAALAGHPFDRRLLAQLPSTADPCAENGEFHTFAWNGPMFEHPIPVAVGDIVERDGFVFADVRAA